MGKFTSVIVGYYLVQRATCPRDKFCFVLNQVRLFSQSVFVLIIVVYVIEIFEPNHLYFPIPTKLFHYNNEFYRLLITCCLKKV